jgi:hypothetical protein
MGSYRQFYSEFFGISSKQRSRKKSIGAGARRLGKFWIIFGAEY